VIRSDFQCKIMTRNGYGKYHIVRECHLPNKYAGEAQYSIANYRSEIKQHLKAGKALREYYGPTNIPFITFDFDCGKSSIDTLSTKMFEYIEYLRLERHIPSEYLRIYFSGYKGFHLEIPSKIFGIKPEYKLETKIRELVNLLTAGLPIREYVDWQVYVPHRLIRLSNSIHPKSKQYKIPITIDDLRV
jgi:hypothetical protein